MVVSIPYYQCVLPGWLIIILSDAAVPDSIYYTMMMEPGLCQLSIKPLIKFLCKTCPRALPHIYLTPPPSI